MFAPRLNGWTMRIKNVVASGNSIATVIWRQLDELIGVAGARTALVERLRLDSGLIERICGQHGVTPSALEAPSRQVYCWLKLLLSGDNLAAHLAAAGRARAALRSFPPHPVLPVLFHLAPLDSLWRSKVYADAVYVRCSQAYMHAPQEVFDALAAGLRGRSGADARGAARDWSLTEEFSAVLFELESFAPPPDENAAGRVHDLEAAFARVNTQFFRGEMPKPVLGWNRVITSRLMGHYHFARDRVVISVTLDAPAVPEYVLDFVMYHELLHKRHGMQQVERRRVAHSAAFRADERLFPRHAEAQAFLDALGVAQSGSRQTPTVLVS